MILSIITINLNNALGLRKTILSVVNQTFIDYEYILIDGGSTDRSPFVIKEFNERIQYWSSEPDKGIYNAMNKGIRRAKGKYLLFLNSGDWLVDDWILEKVFTPPIPTEDIIYGDIFYVNPDGTKKLMKSLGDQELTLANFNTNKIPTIQHPAAFIRKELFNEHLYDETYQIIADIKFFIEKIIFKNCSVRKLNLTITNFNIEGLSSNPQNYARTIEERNRIFRELTPPRIFKDYEVYASIKDSPLIRFIPFLETTTGLHKLAFTIIKSMVELYKFISHRN